MTDGCSVLEVTLHIAASSVRMLGIECPVSSRPLSKSEKFNTASKQLNKLYTMMSEVGMHEFASMSGHSWPGLFNALKQGKNAFYEMRMMVNRLLDVMKMQKQVNKKQLKWMTTTMAQLTIAMHK